MKLLAIYLSFVLIVLSTLSRADTFNITDSIADYNVTFSNYIADYSIVISDYIGDYSIAVEKGDCSITADHSISITNDIGDYSVVISNYIGDYSVVISNYIGDHTVCVPSNSTKEQIEEYVAAVVVVAIELGIL